MSIFAAILVALLVLLALLHIYWGFGGRWPGHDEASLVDFIVGRTQGMRAPSLGAAALVAAGLLTAAVLVWFRTGPFAGAAFYGLAPVGYWAVALVFLCRGVAGFIPAVFRYAEGTRFHRLNRLFYSPLCLAIFVGFVAVK